MRPTIILSVVVLAFYSGGSLTTTTHDGQQQQTRQDSQTTQQSALYYCTMHPEITSDKPGECSKCSMALVKKESNEKEKTQQPSAKENVQQAKKLLADAKKQLTREGKYNCCVKDPCNQCALDHQSCPCYDNLKDGKTVCPECYGGWQRGEGKDKSIKPADVKTSFSTHQH
ncbi:MAG TPA: heavy metal-binding domain-containing protein [Bacteroidota bacterium]